MPATTSTGLLTNPHRKKRLSPETAAERAAVMNSLRTVVDVVGVMVGPNVEVVLHDLAVPERSIVAIANGHISNRRVGHPILSGPKNDKGFAAAVEALTARGSPQHSVIDDYPTVTASGQQLRSATAIFRDSKGDPFAALCMNADLTVVQMAHSWLGQLLQHGREPEPIASEAPDMDLLTNEILSEAVKRLGKPVSLMNKDEKVRAVESMLERGLFMVKGGVEKAAAALKVTRFTVYNYLEELRQRNGGDAVLQRSRRPSARVSNTPRKRAP